MDDAEDQPLRKPGSGLAITALVLGIVGLLMFPLAIAALVLGIVALAKGQSKGMAITGIVLGGLGLLVLPLAIVAAIAIPNLLESRISSNEAAASSSLKAGVFPAEIQFQAGGYHDRDHDGIGDFGFFAEMAGGPIAGKTEVHLTLLPQTWNMAKPLVNSYHFAVYLPDGAGGAIAAEDDHDLPASADRKRGPESDFVAYAWPTDLSVGRRAFAITAAGMVYASPPGAASAVEPKWNTLFGGKGWQDAKAWEPYRR